MAVRWSWCALIVGLMGCSGGEGGTATEVPTGTARDDAGDAGRDPVLVPTPDAGDQADAMNILDGEVPSDAGASSDAATLPDANATKPPGNTLSNAADAGAPWSEGDPAKLYPYVAAYRYADTGDVEIEFSATPATSATGNRIVVRCGTIGSLCLNYFYRAERSCNHSTTGGSITSPLTINADKTVSGHFEPLKFPQGTLAADAVNLPVVAVAKHACADGLP